VYITTHEALGALLDNCDCDNWPAKHWGREVKGWEVIYWDCTGPNMPTLQWLNQLS